MEIIVKHSKIIYNVVPDTAHQTRTQDLTQPLKDHFYSWTFVSFKWASYKHSSEVCFSDEKDVFNQIFEWQSKIIFERK